jgi:hypothetical protein
MLLCPITGSVGGQIGNRRWPRAARVTLAEHVRHEEANRRSCRNFCKKIAA